MHTKLVDELGVYRGSNELIDESRNRRQPVDRLSVTLTHIYAKPRQAPQFAPTSRVGRRASGTGLAVIFAVMCLLVGTIVGAAIGSRRGRVNAAASITKPVPTRMTVTPIEAAQSASRAPSSGAPAPDPATRSPAAPVQAPAPQVPQVPVASAVAASVSPTTVEVSSPAAAAGYDSASASPGDQVPPEVVPVKPAPAHHVARTHRHVGAAPTRTASEADASEGGDFAPVRAKQPAKVNKPKREKLDLGTCAKEVLGCIDKVESPVKNEQPKKARKSREAESPRRSDTGRAARSSSEEVA
jgi:hypothetical protein